MKKKGFTLVELLAVIVVLAIIALIAVPTILGVIDKAKRGAFKASVMGIIESGELYLATGTLNYNENDEMVFTCNGSKCETSTGEKLSFKGEVPVSGNLVIKKDGTIEASLLTNNNYCASGKRTNLDIQKDCSDVSITGLIYAYQISYKTKHNSDVKNVKQALDYLIEKTGSLSNSVGEQ